MTTRLSRRRFLQATGAAALAASCQSSPPAKSGGLNRLIVLGVDGMDPGLLERFVAEGRMPHCAALMQTGSFRRLGTSNPPQSPVAWSNFISGTNPGGHGIFDFIARDPQTMQLYQSTARTEPGSEPLRLGDWSIPTSATMTRNRRRGPTFWDDLERHGVPCTVLRVPANFPPSDTEATTLSGMGTPDLQGGYGIFTYFTDDPSAQTRNISGGRIEQVLPQDHVLVCPLHGPPNEFAASGASVTVPIVVYRDPERDEAKIVVQETTLILKAGEWSDWIVVRFPLLPWAVEVTGLCRLYLKQVHEPFGLYVSPVNINPADPAAPISTPPDYSRQLVREIGYFYTEGMAEDTKALSAGVLGPAEYREQALFVHAERMRFYRHELARFERGFLFFYLSTLDLSSHVFWQTLDAEHPLYTREFAAAQGDFIGSLYGLVDEAVGEARARLGPHDQLLVLSDHGFNSFRRQFNLNSWLLDEGYLRTNRGAVRAGSTAFQDVSWGASRAYGVGLNGLYLNRAGRERDGCVREAEVEALARELVTRLAAIRDPETETQVIARVFRSAEVYQGPYAAEAPDLIIGYNRNYRASWDTILGGFPRQQILDNTNVWSGDHCIDPSFVPGVWLSNRPLRERNPTLEDVAPTILAAFGVPPAAGMTGRRLV